MLYLEAWGHILRASRIYIYTLASGSHIFNSNFTDKANVNFESVVLHKFRYKWIDFFAGFATETYVFQKKKKNSFLKDLSCMLGLRLCSIV